MGKRTSISATNAVKSELVITRVFDAPSELVWKAWTECKRLMLWWGPKGFTAPFCKIDLRVGGVYHNCMRSPEGKDYWSTGVYREIIPLEMIVCTDSFADKEGNVVPATYYGMSEAFPLEMLVTVTFEGIEGKTKLTLTHVGLPPGEDHDNCRSGWNESFDKLAEVLAKAQKKEREMDMQEMMEAYEKLAVPTAPHKMLAKLVGSWTTKTRAWCQTEPGNPPMESTGTCEQKMLLGGRYLQQEYTGDMMGSPFAGINLIGYDNYTKKYVSTWIDSMSTGIYYFEGTASADRKTITQESSYDDPIKGPIVWRSVTKIVDDNTLQFEMYLTPKGGEEEKAMEMTVTRMR